MKKLIKLFVVALYLLPLQQIKAQSDVLSHLGTNPAWYVGWSNLTTTPLVVQHGGNYPIRFLTNNYQRMIMFNGAGNCTDGRVAFANDMPSGFSPQARIHAFQFGGTLNGSLFRTDGPETVTNTWNLYTGPTQVGATEKFRLSIPASTNNVVMETIQAGFIRPCAITTTFSLYMVSKRSKKSIIFNQSLTDCTKPFLYCFWCCC